LRTHCSVDVQQNRDVVLGASVEHPVNVVLSTIKAPNIRSVGLQNPVTNGEANHLNTSR
jgi:hypothetical protein